MSDPETLPPKTGHYARFLRAGGVVSLADWERLAAEDRNALEAAGEVVWLERAERIGGASTRVLAALMDPPPPAPCEDALEKAGRDALKAVGA